MTYVAIKYKFSQYLFTNAKVTIDEDGGICFDGLGVAIGTGNGLSTASGLHLRTKERQKNLAYWELEDPKQALKHGLDLRLIASIIKIDRFIEQAKEDAFLVLLEHDEVVTVFQIDAYCWYRVVYGTDFTIHDSEEELLMAYPDSKRVLDYLTDNVEKRAL